MKRLQLFFPLLLMVSAVTSMASWGVSGQMTQAPLAEDNQLTDRERLLRLEQQVDKLAGLMAAADAKRTVATVSALRRELQMLKAHMARDVSVVKANLNQVNDHLQRLDSRAMTAKGELESQKVSSLSGAEPLAAHAPKTQVEKKQQVAVEVPKTLVKVAKVSPVLKSKPVKSHSSKKDDVVIAFE